MNKISGLLKVLFHIFNLVLILLYLYPGSLFGYFLYGDIKKQPQITNDFLNISSNHFYVFVLLSILGILAYFKDQNISLVIKYLFLLSITLELFHIIIPERTFQYEDLFGNILGTTIILILYKILK
mgnify:CR=1 FL=1|tara:strand:+ start:778 stop:1155 length:378 start_codon:yes stop_codon:yes gene_type:complete